MKHRVFGVVLAAFFTAHFSPEESAHGNTLTWNVPSGTWFDEIGLSPLFVPTNADEVVSNNGGTSDVIEPNGQVGNVYIATPLGTIGNPRVFHDLTCGALAIGGAGTGTLLVAVGDELNRGIATIDGPISESDPRAATINSATWNIGQFAVGNAKSGKRSVVNSGDARKSNFVGNLLLSGATPCSPHFNSSRGTTPHAEIT